MTSYEDRILRVKAYIRDHADEDLSLDRLAEVAAMSRFHWHRVYKAMCGETCAQTVRRVRLERAALRLIQSDQPVGEIARTSGYGTVASFSRAFAGAYGLPPAVFRARGALTTPPDPTHRGETIMYPVEITSEPTRRLAALPHQGAYTEIGGAFEALTGLLTARALWPTVSGMAGIYWDDPSAVPEADLRSHAGAILTPVVSEGPEVAPPLTEIVLAKGRHAVLRHAGPYATLHVAYDWLYGTWLPQSGEEPADRPAFEVYLNTPMDTAPDDLRTNICVPLV